MLFVPTHVHTYLCKCTGLGLVYQRAGIRPESAGNAISILKKGKVVPLETQLLWTLDWGLGLLIGDWDKRKKKERERERKSKTPPQKKKEFFFFCACPPPPESSQVITSLYLRLGRGGGGTRKKKKKKKKKNFFIFPFFWGGFWILVSLSLSPSLSVSFCEAVRKLQANRIFGCIWYLRYDWRSSMVL